MNIYNKIHCINNLCEKNIAKEQDFLYLCKFFKIKQLINCHFKLSLYTLNHEKSFYTLNCNDCGIATDNSQC